MQMSDYNRGWCKTYTKCKRTQEKGHKSAKGLEWGGSRKHHLCYLAKYTVNGLEVPFHLKAQKFWVTRWPRRGLRVSPS